MQSGDEATSPRFPIPFSQFFLENVLCRNWPEKTEHVEQEVIPVVLKLIHDMPTAGHPGGDRTLAAARRVYYWPTIRIDIDRYVAQSISRAKHKDTTKCQAPIPTTRISVERCFNRFITVTKESFRLTVPPGVCVCVDHFSIFVVPVPVKNITPASAAHALVTAYHPHRQEYY